MFGAPASIHAFRSASSEEGSGPTFNVSSEIESALQSGALGSSKAARTSSSNTATNKLCSALSPMNGTPLQPEKLPIKPEALPWSDWNAVVRVDQSCVASMPSTRPGAPGAWQPAHSWNWSDS